jgi:hypothetical protein
VRDAARLVWWITNATATHHPSRFEVARGSCESPSATGFRSDRVLEVTGVLANILVYLFLAIILVVGALGAFYYWRDRRTMRSRDDAQRPGGGTGAPRD